MATPITIPNNSMLIPVNLSSSFKTFTLPVVSTNPGRMIIFKDMFGNAANSTMRLSTIGLDRIERSNISSMVLSNAYGAWWFTNDGITNWFLTNAYLNTLYLNPRFTPISITGLQLWLDGSDSTTLSLTGSTVTAWRDKSGNGKNTIVAGTPTIGNNINSVQSITTGTGNYFTGPISITTTTLTCFAVARTTQTQPRSGSDQRLVSVENGTNVDYGRTDGAIVLFNQSGTSTMANYRVTGPLASNPVVTNTPFLAVSQFNGTTGALWFNGTAGTLASSASSGSFATTKYGIGNRANPSGEVWIGYIGEIILYNTALTTTQRQQVEGYLAWKWGLQGSLPANHPYKNAAPP